MTQNRKNLSRTGGMLMVALMLAAVVSLGYFALKAVNEHETRQAGTNNDDASTVGDTDDADDISSVLDSFTDSSSSDDSGTNEDDSGQVAKDDMPDTGDGSVLSTGGVETVPSTGSGLGIYVLIAITTTIAAVAHRIRLYFKFER